MITRLTILLLLSLSLLIAGCSLVPETSEKTYHVIAPDFSELSQPQLTKLCRQPIKFTSGDTAVLGRKMYYSEVSTERNPYFYSFWYESPLDQLNHLFKLLQTKHCRKYQQQTVYTVELLALYHNASVKPGEAILIAASEQPEKYYELSAPLATFDAKGFVDATNDVLEDFLLKLLN